ncbi:MAG: pirin family protein [Phycisphaerales bacterium JB040]
MLTVKESGTRGHADHGWLNAKHSFSFGTYQDPHNVHFRALRVINEDVVQPKRGFSTHPHSDMEIITYPISGTLRHSDSLGHAEELTHGMIQRMTAGSGIEHSEHNGGDEPLHLLQIWIFPREKGLPPSHESVKIPVLDQPNELHLLVSEDGENGSLVMQQDARMRGAVLHAGKSITHVPKFPNVWVQVIKGSISVNGSQAKAGDAVKGTETELLTIEATEDSEFLLFERA